MDSAFWKEWELFNLPGGLSGFLLIHFPILFIILLGLMQLAQGLYTGLIISGVLSLGGVFAFSIYTYFINRGREEFKTPVSQLILIGTMFLSIIQGVLTIQQLLY